MVTSSIEGLSHLAKRSTLWKKDTKVHLYVCVYHYLQEKINQKLVHSNKNPHGRVFNPSEPLSIQRSIAKSPLHTWLGHEKGRGFIKVDNRSQGAEARVFEASEWQAWLEASSCRGRGENEAEDRVKASLWRVLCLASS